MMNSLKHYGGVTFVAALFFFTAFLIAKSENAQNLALLRWDAAGYYAYLPAFFIHQDATFGFYEPKSGKKANEFIRNKSGWYLNKYGCGVAMLQSPFFLAGHIVAKRTLPEAAGFGWPYYYAVMIGAALYGALGLFFLGLSLQTFFSKTASILTITALGFGTNLFYYSSFEGMMSHVYSFFLFALLLWLTLQWKKKFAVRWMLALALTGGLIIATRLSNGLVLLVPLLWGLKSWKDFANQSKQVFLHAKWLPVALVCFILPSLPHLLYLHHITGQWMIEAYSGEHFFWNQPLAHKVLFSFRKGWFVWSPVLLLGGLGFFFIKKHQGTFAISVFLILNLYLVSSWWCWWYGGGFGMRALIESSVFMAIPMAAFIDQIRKSKVLSYAFAAIFPWLIALNLFQTHQYQKGIIHYDAMTEKAYWEIFGYPHPVPQTIMDKRNQYLEYTDAAKAMEDANYRAALE
ncbi:MAG: hypothetical protein KDC24_08585 [Saprospiraceae bacterium]|nr:hypothetical protein [Saprospiraceae bacterium]